MSTNWYFECHSHDPVIRSDGEFTQHTNDEHYKMAIQLANSRPLDFQLDGAIFKDNVSQHYGRNMISFLLQHPNCDLKIVNEYGKREDIPPTPMTVGMLMNRLSTMDPDTELVIYSQRGSGVLRAGGVIDPDSVDIIEEDDKGATVFSKPENVDWTEEAIRVDGRTKCEICGLTYKNHKSVTKHVPTLVRGCDGKLLKT